MASTSGWSRLFGRGAPPEDFGPRIAAALGEEFGYQWAEHLPQRILDAVWDGDHRSLDSDERRFDRALGSCPLPRDTPLSIEIEVVQRMFASALRWVELRPVDDPHGDSLRYGEVGALLRERVELQMRAYASGTTEVNPLAGRWVAMAADLLVRAVRFRDPFVLPELGRQLSQQSPGGSRHAAEQLTYEIYLAHLAGYGNIVVNGVSIGSHNAADCLRQLRARYAGDDACATAIQAAMVAIARHDIDTLRELGDLTAAAADEPDSPVWMLHSLALAGEKVLHER